MCRHRPKFSNHPAAQNPPTNKKFWRFTNTADGSAELMLYGDIAQNSWYGDEVTPKDFKADLDALGAVSNILVRINSGGGDVWAAQNIGNLLEQHPATVTARIDGLCASAATIVACHCDKVEAAEDTSYMIHPVQVGLCGYMGAVELEQYKQALDSIKENILGLYEKKTGQKREDLTAWMDATRWWTATQAKDKGFIDEIINTEQAAKVENRGGLLFINSVNMSLPFEAAPKNMQDMAAPAAPEDKAPAGVPESNCHEEGKDDMEIKTLDDARKAFPDLIAQAETEAKNAAVAAERARLQAIDKVAKLFPAEMVNKAKYDEKDACDAKELTYRAALADAEAGTKFLDQRSADIKNGGAPAVGSVPPANQNPAAEDTPANAAAQGSKDGKEFVDMMKKGQVK